ncbi:MAG: hypothetical protein ABIH25_03750 [Candidatus Woesearchaeota archaeon]
MYEIYIDPSRVLPWEHRNTTDELVEITKAGNLYKLGPILGFELPNDHINYLLLDGHKRLEAARVSGVNLLMAIIQKPSDFDLISNSEYRTWVSMSKSEFKKFVENTAIEAVDFLA